MSGGSETEGTVWSFVSPYLLPLSLFFSVACALQDRREQSVLAAGFFLPPLLDYYYAALHAAVLLLATTPYPAQPS